MIYITTCFFIFLLIFSIQIWWHRILLKYGRRSIKILLLYIPGLFAAAGIFFMLKNKYPQDIQLPLTGCFFYILLSLLAAVSLITPILGGYGPTSEILTLIKRKKILGYQEILHSFSDKTLYYDRINNLTKVKLIRQKKGKYYLSAIGYIAALVIKAYYLVLNMNADN